MTADKDPDLVRHEMLMANYARNDPALANMWNWTDKDGWATGHTMCCRRFYRLGRFLLECSFGRVDR